VSVEAPDKSKSGYSYEANSSTITNALGQTRQETHNVLDQLVEVKDYIGGQISYSYTARGQLKSVVTEAPDAAAITLNMCYDRLGRKIAMRDPDKGGWLASVTSCANVTESSPGWWHYKYNAFGELIAQTDAKNQLTTMEYDQLGRMILRQGEDQTRWYYDKDFYGKASAGSQGKLMNMLVRNNAIPIASFNGVTDQFTGYTYDSLGRLTDTQVLYPNQTTGYFTQTRYDSIGRPYEQRDALNISVLLDSGVQTHYNAFGYPYRTIQ
jgi:YD repeat-containing protein